MPESRTIFKNANKPEYYHPNCKCVNKEQLNPEFSVIFDPRKMTYVFNDVNKCKMVRTMGYIPEDAEEMRSNISRLVISGFSKGEYKLGKLNENGQHISVFYNIPGKRDCSDISYRCIAGCVAWPNGKILVATPIIKEKKQ